MLRWVSLLSVVSGLFLSAAPALAVDFGAICEILKNKKWAEIIAGSTEFSPQISGKESGVLNDRGSRKFLEKNIPDCGDGKYGITLRYTQDRVGERAVYETFVKSQKTDEIIGLAIDNFGAEIAEVPLDVASDKKGLYGSKATSAKITGRNGCFKCHGANEDDVSISFGVKGAEEFWKKSKPVEKFPEEKPVILVKANPKVPAKTTGSGESYICSLTCTVEYTPLNGHLKENLPEISTKNYTSLPMPTKKEASDYVLAYCPDKSLTTSTWKRTSKVSNFVCRQATPAITPAPKPIGGSGGEKKQINYSYKTYDRGHECSLTCTSFYVSILDGKEKTETPEVRYFTSLTMPTRKIAEERVRAMCTKDLKEGTNFRSWNEISDFKCRER